ncbi:MAG: hypothetical protein HYZ14_03175 [Bacteroidetes bacterium]|nr:hypothetical protein [Bacteroidota bacterium]
MNSTEIKESIKIGLRKGYRQNILLIGSYTNFTDQVREYLLTVNVAQQLLEWNQDYSFKIRIEYPVLYFFNNAFSEMDWNIKDFYDREPTFRQDGHSPTKNHHQKIDIAITREELGNSTFMEERTLVGIELKGINKVAGDIIHDVKRMSDAMIRSDNISPNSIEYCFCGFLRRIDKDNILVTDDFIKSRTAEEQSYWEKKCEDLKLIYPILNFNVEMFEIIYASLEANGGWHERYNYDYYDQIRDTGMVVGYVLTISKNIC